MLKKTLIYMPFATIFLYLQPTQDISILLSAIALLYISEYVIYVLSSLYSKNNKLKFDYNKKFFDVLIRGMAVILLFILIQLSLAIVGNNTDLFEYIELLENINATQIGNSGKIILFFIFIDEIIRIFVSIKRNTNIDILWFDKIIKKIKK